MSEKKKAREKDLPKENAIHSDLDELITETEILTKVKQLSSSMYLQLTQQVPVHRLPQNAVALQAAHLGASKPPTTPLPPRLRCLATGLILFSATLTARSLAELFRSRPSSRPLSSPKGWFGLRSMEGHWLKLGYATREYLPVLLIQAEWPRRGAERLECL